MVSNELLALQQDVHHQSAVVNAARHRIYARDLSEISEKLWEDLARAEAELQRLLEQQRAAESQEQRGVILNFRSAAADGVMGRDTTGIDVQVRLRMERIPSSIVHLLDAEKHPLVTFQIENASSRTRRLCVSTWVEGYSATTVRTLELPRTEQAQVSQLLTYFPDRLAQLTEMTRATLHVQVVDMDGKQEIHNSQPIWLLARNSAYLSIKDPSTGDFIDLTSYLAAWVTPHAEDVLLLVREAADHHAESMIAGYQGDAGFVETQVRAMFAAVQAREIRYINSVICFGLAQGEHMQRVRLPRESLETRSANCIDGTVLFASLIEAASMNPGIVLIPGHAFLAWQTQADGPWDYLETTMVSGHSFEEARDVGRQIASQYQAAQQSMGSASMRLLPVAAARSVSGVMPME